VPQALGELEAFPEAAEAFDRLDDAGIPALTLTNGGREHTEKLLEQSGLRHRVQRVVTVDKVEAYKPHREPYLHTARTLSLQPAALALIAAHGWDIVGAHAAGLAAVWIDRLEKRWPFPTDEQPTAHSLVEAVG